MPEQRSLYIRALQKLIFAFGIVLVLYMLIYSVREATKVSRYRKSGEISTAFTPAGDSLLVFAGVDTMDFVGSVYPSKGDTLTRILDSTAALSPLMYFGSPHEPGTVVPVEFGHGGARLKTEIRFAPLPLAPFFQIAMLEIIKLLSAFSFVAVGVWAFLKRPDSAGVRALTMFCLSMAAFFGFGINAIPNPFASFEMPFGRILLVCFQYFGILFCAFWLNLQLLFPRPKSFIKKWPFGAYLICYLPINLAFSPYIITGSGRGVTDYFIFGVIFVQVTAGFFILGFSRRRTENNLEKRQIRLVQWGVGIGLTSLGLIVLIGIFFGEWVAALKWSLLLINLFLLPILLAPLTFAYAFNRYRLLEVEGKLRRGTRYVLVTVLMLAVSVGLVYLTGEFFLRQLAFSSRIPTFMVALVLALGFTPAWRKTQAMIENRIYPERHHLRTIMRDFLLRVNSMPDRETLWSQVESLLRESLKIEAIYPALKTPDSGVFLHDRAKTKEETPFFHGSELILWLENANRPLLIDEAIASKAVHLTPDEQSWLEQRQIAMLLPLAVHSRLIGFLGLGFKLGREDYTVTDVQILSTFASQVALASENIRLIEENVDKKRMEEELQLARRIQQGFLPRQIPSTPRLEVATASRFCHEVAGDYYDVIALPEGETVLAIGDVSGKGAGAALLMASLQASLRTSIGAHGDLAETVARINDFIHQNTPSEQYITFFVAVFDPRSLILTYVNAGHNPPLLVHQDGEFEKLEAGGIILGYLSGIKYEQSTVLLKPGDSILMYTDGICEAMNASGEEFGEERILAFVKQNSDLTLQEFLSNLEETAGSFTGGAPWADDLTLLLARAR